MTLKIEGYTERRASVTAAKWMGYWEDGPLFAKLFRGATGYAVSGETLTVYRSGNGYTTKSIDGDGSVIIQRGTYLIIDPEGFVSELVEGIDFHTKWMKA